MARSNNKYTSINFNHIHDKKVVAPTNNPNNNHNSSSPHKNHGRMLVLTRPISKPAPAPFTIISPSSKVNVPEPHQQDPISLRPLGRTGSVSLSPVTEREAPRPEKFVPPHLRPGFSGREERPGPAERQQLVGPYGVEARPRSGGGVDPALLDRPRSSGNRLSPTG